MAQVRTQNPKRCPLLEGMEPLEVASQLSHLPGLIFFDTAGHLPSSAEQPVSLIAAKPNQTLVGSIHRHEDHATLRKALAEIPEIASDHGFPLGGLAGWIGYEGDFVFGQYEQILIFEHSHRQWWELGALSSELETMMPERVKISPFRAKKDKEHFIQSVERIQKWILDGDIYQANLSQAFEAEVQGGSLFGLYEALRDASPAPMAAWLSLAGKELLCSSPESFLKISGARVETRPIKGTRPRFDDPDADTRSAYELQTSPKEVAELVMITDLLRNDLGQVCECGSVEVDEMLKLESLEQVHHLVSTISGNLRPGMDAIDCLAACFPGGSITGAPKKRAIEIIKEVEGRQRGIYCGAIGWLGGNGESSFNIAIRTLVREDDRLSYRVGAGIVADSDPAHEYQETLDKAAGIRLAIQRWIS